MLLKMYTIHTMSVRIVNYSRTSRKCTRQQCNTVTTCTTAAISSYIPHWIIHNTCLSIIQNKNTSENNRQRRYFSSSNNTVNSSNINKNVNNNNNNNYNNNYTPVIIVGGGPSGLMMSILLSQYSIPHRLIEGQTLQQRFQHPQAHFLNTRTMEILKYNSILPVPYTKEMENKNEKDNNNETTTTVSSTNLYDRIRSAMPPVHQWQKFRFTYNMNHTNPLAEVLHRVDIPIQCNTDANGKLIQSNTELLQATTTIPSVTQSNNSNSKTMDRDTSNDLSPCSVGHLAQHTACKILYEEVLHRQQKMKQVSNTVNNSEILFATKVINVQYKNDNDNDSNNNNNNNDTNLIHVTTTGNDNIYTTSLLVAADGANSYIRQEVCTNIGWNGKYGMQHLMNIHVQLTEEQCSTLHYSNNNNTNHAMLYSICNENVVAMVVCHSIGEYIIQIPYFPPYQTIETDFNEQRIQLLVQAIFGLDNINIKDQVKSCRPWVMSSMIADKYYEIMSNSINNTINNNCGIVLVGDAAHVFPPAGGFGMNTGIQDVHNLAWKVSQWWCMQEQQQQQQQQTDRRKESIVQSANTSSLSLYDILQSYESERRPIAQANAALSVRNYHRLLDVMKSLYLNDNHPAALQALLHISPIPLSTKQTIFRNLLQTALSPLRFLRDDVNTQSSSSSFTNNQLTQGYVQHIRSNIRKKLDSGAGLPLLFPNFEIGFVYSQGNVSSVAATSSMMKSKKDEDTWASKPTLVVGGLVPHVEVEVIDGDKHYPYLQYLKSSDAAETKATTGNNSSPCFISTRDLSCQMTTTALDIDDDNSRLLPTYTILFVKGNDDNQSNLNNLFCARDLLQESIGLPVMIAYLSRYGSANSCSSEMDFFSAIQEGGTRNPILVLREHTTQSSFSFFARTIGSNSSNTSNNSSKEDEKSSYAILIRPDGHIDSISTDIKELRPQLSVS